MTSRGSAGCWATDIGLSLHQMVRGIKTWAELRMDDVLTNRTTYDTRVA